MICDMKRLFQTMEQLNIKLDKQDLIEDQIAQRSEYTVK